MGAHFWPCDAFLTCLLGFAVLSACSVREEFSAARAERIPTELEEQLSVAEHNEIVRGAGGLTGCGGTLRDASVFQCFRDRASSIASRRTESIRAHIRHLCVDDRLMAALAQSDSAREALRAAGAPTIQMCYCNEPHCAQVEAHLSWEGWGSDEYRFGVDEARPDGESLHRLRIGDPHTDSAIAVGAFGISRGVFALIVPETLSSDPHWFSTCGIWDGTEVGAEALLEALRLCLANFSGLTCAVACRDFEFDRAAVDSYLRAETNRERVN